MENHGRCLATGSSRRSRPASRCCITATLVKSFEMEQIEYIVDGVAGAFVSTCAVPKPRLQRSCWSWTTAIETPGSRRYACSESTHAVRRERAWPTRGSAASAAGATGPGAPETGAAACAVEGVGARRRAAARGRKTKRSLIAAPPEESR